MFCPNVFPKQAFSLFKFIPSHISSWNSFHASWFNKSCRTLTGRQCRTLVAHLFHNSDFTTPDGSLEKSLEILSVYIRLLLTLCRVGSVFTTLSGQAAQKKSRAKTTRLTFFFRRHLLYTPNDTVWLYYGFINLWRSSVIFNLCVFWRSMSKHRQYIVYGQR